MKKKATEQATNNIILDDKEMEVLIRQLVKKAGNKGVSMTRLNQAVKTIWKKEFPDEEEKKELSEDEERFAAKVKKFLQHYGEDLIETRTVLINNNAHGVIIEKRNAKWKRNFLKDYYGILCSIYAVFKSGEKITQNRILRFLKEHFDYKNNNLGNELKILNEFFYYYVSFSEAADLPVFYGIYVGWDSKLKKNKEFYEFSQKFQLKNKQTNRVALATVWFIEKYF